jgi:hypothetical protein
MAAMHSLDVASSLPDRELLVKSAPYLRLDHSCLRAGPENAAVADYNNYVWVFGDHYSTGIDITRPCLVRFEGPGEESLRYGPFPAVHIVGPSIFSGLRNTEILARYDCNKHQWLVYQEGKYFDAVVLESV